MLNHVGNEPAMSRPDYEQTPLHHSCLLVLLRGVGPAKPRSLQKAFDKVRHVSNIKITDSNGIVRDIWIRYVHDYPVENNDWGDFQTHRRLLGLITIGKFDNQTELNELCRQHESLKVRYGSTLFDSRAIFFGPAVETSSTTTPTPSSPIKTNHIDTINLEAVNNVTTKNQQNSLQLDIIKQNIMVLDETKTKMTVNAQKRLQDEYTTPNNFKAQAFFYREHDTYNDLNALISDFVNSLFWVLESKRLERSREKVDKVNLLSAPFEKRDFVGLDMESRNNRKRCVGRLTKNLADLSLQAGLVEDSLSLYHSACETLRAIGDALWVGAAEEGLCAASIALLYPELRENEIMQHRNASLQEGASPLRNTPDKWRASDATKKINIIEQQSNLNEQQQYQKETHQQHPTTTTVTTTATTQMTSASSSCSSMSSILTTSSASGTPTSSSSTSTISAATHGQSTNELPVNILKPDEIPSIFRKAIINYSKYRHAAIVETESAVKAARICLKQNRPLDVAMFLQNMLYINILMSDADRIKRYEVITDLYQQLGYRRKAAFFQRFAALKHVQQANSNPDWTQTYRLMLDSFPGYLLSLDPIEVLDNAAGWPSLQIDLLQSLITAARRLGHSGLATRHMTFLLQTQWDNLTEIEQSDMALQLRNLSAQCEGSPVPLVLENGTVIPPANLTDLPFCIDFVVKDLPAHLRPQRIKIIKADSGPFLFTPIHFSSIDRRDKKRDKNKIAFFWVQNDLCEITVRLRNPLPFELTITDMRLLTNGVVFESLPQTVTLQPNVPTYVTLHGKPIEVGQLEIQGYSTHTLGVKSNCRLKHMREREFPPNFIIDVIPALPRISVKTSLPQTATFSNFASADIVITSASLTLYNGESSSCVITINNDSTLPVEHLEVVINSNVELELQKKIFQMDEQELQTKLPIQPNSSIDFTMKIFGEADFLCPFGSQRAASSIHSNSHDFCAGGSNSLQYSTMSSSSGYGTISSSQRFNTYSGQQQQQQQQQIYNRRNETANASFRSTASGGSGSTITTTAGGQSLAALNLSTGNATVALANASQYAQNVEAQFRIKYSGGEAMESGYCRQCAISFNLELLPSAQITSWDVLPAEIASQFYLVLDVSNLTAQEMSLNYTDNKNILIEAKESCRVPIPVDRCSLEEVRTAREAEIADNLERELCFRTQLLSFNDSVSKLCSEHIAKRVKINWLLTGTDIRGIATLRGIILTHTMIDLTTVSPLQWTVTFQNTPVQPQSEIVCIVGESAVLSVSMCNQSTQPLKNLVLTIKFYQDYLNGMENYNLETRLAISGPNRISIPILPQNMEVHHECTVIFFTPGRFKTSIQCCSKPQQSGTINPIATTTTTKTTSNNLLTRSCPAVPTTVTATTTTSTLNDVSMDGAGDLITTRIIFNDIPSAVTSYHEDDQEHIWKFIPPIEVTVVEQ